MGQPCVKVRCSWVKRNRCEREGFAALILVAVFQDSGIDDQGKADGEYPKAGEHAHENTIHKNARQDVQQDDTKEAVSKFLRDFEVVSHVLFLKLYFSFSYKK
jgi:hypothetical protein